MLNSLMARMFALFLFLSLIGFPCVLFAQVESPNKKHLFDEDAASYKQAEKQAVQKILKTDKSPDQDMGIDAPDVQYDKESGIATAKGGAIVSRSGIQAQADEAKINMQTKDSDLKGRVVVTANQGVIGAESGKFNFDTETGDFDNATVDLEDGDYKASAEKLSKLSEFDYHLHRARMTTCHCSDGSVPWEIKGKEADITQEGYARVHGATMEFYGVPIAYAPYLILPAKFERQSGLLRPTYNYSNQDGFEYKQPLFLVLDDSTDITLNPFVETRSRSGSSLDFRKAFSEQNNAHGRFLYSNEAARGDSLRGANIQSPDNPGQTIDDPSVDLNRVGGYYYHYWSTKPEDPAQMSMLADLHLVSDNLFPREIEDDDIVDRDARYASSQVAFRTGLGDYATAQISGDYNQALVTPQNEVLQRLPQFSVGGVKSFHPFGYNPYGVKLVSGLNLDATDFVREEYYDGWREDVNPSVRVPFHIQNFVSGNAGVQYHATSYQLDNTDPLPSDSGTAAQLDGSNSRGIYSFTGNISTALERVFEVAPDSWLTTLTGLGAGNQDNQLRRVKNTISPFVNYYYTPKVDQADLPYFDSLDRIKPKSLVGYGLQSSLYGRFVPVRQSGDAIPELTPRVESLPIFDLNRPLADIGSSDEWAGVGGDFKVPQGDIRDIANLVLFQTYNLRSVQSGSTRVDSFSDIEADLGLNPTESFGFKFASSYNFEADQFNAWGVGSHVHDDRGDILRGYYSFIEGGQSQLETSLEVALTGRTKAAFYARYDNSTQSFIENAAVIRLASSCNCWHFDFGFNDKTNPDKKQVTLTLTFNGLGDLRQGVAQSQNNNS